MFSVHRSAQSSQHSRSEVKICFSDWCHNYNYDTFAIQQVYSNDQKYIVFGDIVQFNCIMGTKRCASRLYNSLSRNQLADIGVILEVNYKMRILPVNPQYWKARDWGGDIADISSHENCVIWKTLTYFANAIEIWRIGVIWKQSQSSHALMRP